VEPTAAFVQLPLGFVDPMQWRSAVIRPLGLFADRTATPRAQATATPPDIGRTLQRCFRQQGMLGLVPARLEVAPRDRVPRVPEAVRRELDRLKALYAGFHARAVARILCFRFGSPIHHHTVKPRWHQRPMAAPPPVRPRRGPGKSQPVAAALAAHGRPVDRARRDRARCRAHRPSTRPQIAPQGLVSGDGGGGLIGQNVIPMPGRAASGACAPDPTLRCVRSAASWRSTSGSRMRSRTCAAKVPGPRPSPIRTKPASPTSVG
jgi:hypothetical protein